MVSTEPKRHYLPLKQRIVAYNEALRLRRKGLSYRQILDAIYNMKGLRIPMTTIAKWIRGRHRPLGRVNQFSGEPSPELSYVIGTLLSDGDRCLDGYNHRLGLQVTDRDFAEAFGQCLTKVLGKEEPYAPYWSQSQQRWIVRVCSILLYTFLDRPLQELKPYIEHCPDCVAAFLRAFFDGEGCISKRELKVYNTNRELLLYIQSLLRQYFGIETTGPHRSAKAGYRFRDPRNGKTYESRKPCYYMYVPVRWLRKFQCQIDFTINWKKRRLIDAIRKPQTRS